MPDPWRARLWDFWNTYCFGLRDIFVLFCFLYFVYLFFHEFSIAVIAKEGSTGTWIWAGRSWSAGTWRRHDHRPRRPARTRLRPLASSTLTWNSNRTQAQSTRPPTPARAPTPTPTRCSSTRASKPAYGSARGWCSWTLCSRSAPSPVSAPARSSVASRATTLTTCSRQQQRRRYRQPMAPVAQLWFPWTSYCRAFGCAARRSYSAFRRRESSSGWAASATP